MTDDKTQNIPSPNDHEVNRAGYDRWAGIYDRYPNPTVAIDDRYFPRLWAGLQPCRILEIGCGTGRHTSKLAAAGHDIVALDLSPGMLSVARAKPGNHRVCFREADFMALPPEDELLRPAGFDAALTALVVEHIADVEGFFARISRILRDGGDFFMSEIHPARTANGVFAHFKDALTGEEVHLSGHPHTQERFEEAARQAGMVVVSCTDVSGDEALARQEERWIKYKDMEMIQIWHFRKIDATS